MSNHTTQELAKSIALEFSNSSDIFTVDVLYVQETNALFVAHENGEHEVISVNLENYDIEPLPGCVYIKDYSEHEGLAESLEAAGVVEIIGTAVAGPFKSRFTLVAIVGI